MENNNQKMYLGVDGKYYQEHELATAYFLATGCSVYDETRPGDGAKIFNTWVYDLVGLSIKKIVDANNVSYEDFLNANQKILAVRLYRERNNCTLREAKEAIDKVHESMSNNI